MAKYYTADEFFRALRKVIKGKSEGGGLFSFEGPKYIVRSGCWTITYDTQTPLLLTSYYSSQDCARMYAGFVNRDGLRFHIYRKTLFSGIKHLLGMQDIIIGDPEFDAAFVITANKPEQAKALFSDQKLRDLISAQQMVNIRTRFDAADFTGGFGDKSDELHFEVPGAFWEVEPLKGLFELFEEMLRQLVRIGSAYELDPSVPVDLPPADSLLRPARQSVETNPDQLPRPADIPQGP